MPRRPKKLSTRKTVAIVGEGSSEWFYFKSVKKNESYNLKVKPEKPKNSNYKYIFKKAENLIKDEYDIVFCLIELDVIQSNDKIYRAYQNQKNKIFKKIKKQIVILEQHPCFEIWFLLHFDKKSGEFHNCKEMIKELKNQNKTSIFKDYDKSRSFFNNHDIYRELLPYMQDAINNSKWLQKQSGNTKCNVHKIFENLDKIKKTPGR
jgi:hypothetical protein